MSIEVPIVTAALWMFFFRKVPSWNWFQKILSSNESFQKHWGGWVSCPYCSGFWLALALRLIMGVSFVSFPEGSNVVLEWTLDSLATALVVLFVIRILDLVRLTISSKE